MRTLARLGVAAGAAGVVTTAAAGLYLGLVTGRVPIDLGIGRRRRPLGPLRVEIRAPRETVFDVIAEPYLGRRTRAMEEKIAILHAGTDLVLAAHRTPIRGRLFATTVETVRFVRPERVEFRLVRGPVPEVTETFGLIESGGITELAYDGELGTDLGAVGGLWGRAVAEPWERVVANTFAAIRAEAERRTGVRSDRSAD